MSNAEELAEIRRLIEKQDMRARRIELALMGDEQMGVNGIVQKVEYHGKKISEFETDKTKVVTGATILGAIAGGIGSLIHKLW